MSGTTKTKRKTRRNRILPFISEWGIPAGAVLITVVMMIGVPVLVAYSSVGPDQTSAAVTERTGYPEIENEETEQPLIFKGEEFSNNGDLSHKLN